MATIKKNFLYNATLTVSGYIFPLLTFPYVSRILGVHNLGIYNFMESIIQYFIILSVLGLYSVGVREIAEHRYEPNKLKNVFSSILVLNLVTSLVAICILIVSSFLIPSLSSYKEMILIGSVRIIFNALLIEWFFNGIENFRFITTRTLIIRSLYVISIFIFVKEKDDYIIYFILTSLLTIANASINLIYSRKFTSFSFRNLSIKKYVKPMFTLGFYHILTSMYISFNVIYLGFVSGEDEVGIYTTATKISGIFLSIFTAFTCVMIPRMSALISEGKSTEFKSITAKSINILFAFVMPLIVIAEIYAPQIISIISGDGYEKAIIPMRLVIPLIFVIGYEQIIIKQMLLPLKKDNAILKNSIYGATVSLICNILFVKHLGAIGSSLVWIAAELAVFVSAQYFVTKYVNYKFPFKYLIIEIIYSLPIILLNILINNLFHNAIIAFAVGVFATILYYIIIICFIKKDSVINPIINSALKKCHIPYQLP